MKRPAVAIVASVVSLIAAGQASAAPSPTASCVATVTSFEAHLGPGTVGAEASTLAPLGELASNLAKAHAGTFDACAEAAG
jgi:hypothetical protein